MGIGPKVFGFTYQCSITELLRHGQEQSGFGRDLEHRLE